MNTRNNKIQELLISSDPEKKVRKGHRDSMAAPQPDHPDQQGTSDVEEEEATHGDTIPHLYVPDLANTILSEAIKDGMILGTTGKRIHDPYPKLKEHIGVKTLKVTIPLGELKIPRNLPVKFITKCAPHPFKERLLLATLKELHNAHTGLQYLPGDNWHIISNRYLWREEMEERLGAFCELGMKYHKCLLEWNATQLMFNTNARHKEEYRLEALMLHISSRIDEILNLLAKDNLLQKKNKEFTFSLTQLNPRAHQVNDSVEAHEFGKALYDEMTGILEVPFIPEEDNDKENGRHTCISITDGSDIPDQTEGRKTKQNNKRNPPEPMAMAAEITEATTTRKAIEKSQHTINFSDKEQHRHNALRYTGHNDRNGQRKQPHHEHHVCGACTTETNTTQHTWNTVSDRE